MNPQTFTDNGYYVGKIYRRLILQGQPVVDAEFSECRFTGCDFSESQFLNCRFSECAFEDCTMNLIVVSGTSFSRTDFRQCNLMGVNWADADSSPLRSQFASITFIECSLRYNTFIGLDLRKLTMTDCNATEASFAEANLTSASLRRTDFSDAVFLHTNLTRADLTGARNYALSMHDNTTTSARFSMPEAIRLLHHSDIVLVDADSGEPIQQMSDG